MSEKLCASEASNLQLTTETTSQEQIRIQLQEISGKYQTSTEELKMAQEQIRQLEIKVQEKQAPMDEFRALLKDATQKVKSDEISRLENLLKSAEAETLKMKAEIQNKDAEAEKMAGENDKLKQQIEQSCEDLAAFEKRYRETNASLKECRKSLETANREKERMAEQFVKTRKEHSKLAADIEKYKTEMRLKDAELETCKKDAIHLGLTRQCLADFKKRHSELSQENATLKDQNNSSVVKIREMEQKTSELEAKIGELEAEKKQNADKNDTLVKELQAELENAANARSHAYRTLTDLIPQLLAPSETRKRPLPEAQSGPQPNVYFAKRSCADNIPDTKVEKRRRGTTVEKCRI
ncbi:hypothetical protein Ddc_16338 [Ditylenchus destructor]|nr:hypothetical protein Ddc_16338 [Ditylenchus destructor]